MAGSLPWKLYDKTGNYLASAERVELLAMVIASVGDGANIRCNHKNIVWTEGEGFSKGSGAEIVKVCHARRQELVRSWQDDSLRK